MSSKDLKGTFSLLFFLAQTIGKSPSYLQHGTSLSLVLFTDFFQYTLVGPQPLLIEFPVGFS
jgi:hypothetical protein